MSIQTTIKNKSIVNEHTRQGLSSQHIEWHGELCAQPEIFKPIQGEIPAHHLPGTRLSVTCFNHAL